MGDSRHEKRIRVYSNCDEVELFNDVQSESLGRLGKGPIGTHFEWNNVNIKYNVLHVVGYVDGKPVAEDCIVLDHLPRSLISIGFIRI